MYVVDDADRLVGVITLKKVLTTSLRTKISEVYDPEVISVKTNMDAEEVAQVMEKYNLVFISVVDGLGKLVGRITIDDVVDVARVVALEDPDGDPGIGVEPGNALRRRRRREEHDSDGGRQRSNEWTRHRGPPIEDAPESVPVARGIRAENTTRY